MNRLVQFATEKEISSLANDELVQLAVTVEREIAHRPLLAEFPELAKVAQAYTWVTRSNQITRSRPNPTDVVVEELLGRPVMYDDRTAKSDSIMLSARKSILSNPMVSSAEVSQIVGSTGRNRHDIPSRLRRSGALLGLKHGRGFIHPKFQFDLTAGAVIPMVARVNKILGAQKGLWSTASWWFSPTGYYTEDDIPKWELATMGDGDSEEVLVNLALHRDETV